RYRLAVLAERFGADAETQDVLEAISPCCSARIDPKRGLRCGAYLLDIPPPRPPDLPRSVLPRERLRLIRGARGSTQAQQANCGAPVPRLMRLRSIGKA